MMRIDFFRRMRQRRLFGPAESAERQRRARCYFSVVVPVDNFIETRCAKP